MEIMILILAAASGVAIYRSVPAFRRHIDNLAGEELLHERKEEKKENIKEASFK